mgnify:CR=1 FL=1
MNQTHFKPIKTIHTIATIRIIFLFCLYKFRPKPYEFHPLTLLINPKNLFTFSIQINNT